MDDPNITMEEYIRLQKEKALSRGEMFDSQTATYDRMEYYEIEDNSFLNLETKYPAIVFDDTSDTALSCKPTVSPLDNNKIDFKISFDESDDEDYLVIFDENSFSCKIIYVDNLKTDSEDAIDEVNMASSLSPEPTIGYIDNLDFFKDFENDFPTIAYNDLKSISDPLIEPSVYMAPFPHRDLRHPWLKFQTLGDRLSMVYTRDDGQALFTTHAWMWLFEFILALGLHTKEEMAEAGFRAYWSGRGRHLRRHAKGRKSRARLLGGHIIRRLAAHFRLVTDQGLRGLLVVDAAGAPGAAEDALAANEGARAVPASVQAPQPPPPAPQHQTMSQRIKRLKEELVDANGRTYQAFDSTLVGSSRDDIK
ncbi:hypothetical protein Tco_0276368 [Tanacetum coccineum]